MADTFNSDLRSSRKRKVPFPIEEKGMEFFAEDGDFDESIVDSIKHYKWEIFVHPPGDFCLELVLEFYRNIDAGSNESVVMGKKVNFSPECINQLFGLESVNDDLTSTLLAAPNWDQVEQKLCPFGANWVFKPSGERKSLMGINIGKKIRPWVSFISSRLMPITSNSLVMVPRLLVLYAICTQLPINVGQIININIKACVDDPNARSIFFPSTISALLKFHGVYSPPQMVITLSSLVITKSFWNRCDETDGPRRQSGQREKPRQAYPNAQLALTRQMALQLDGLVRQVAQLVIKHDKAEEIAAERMARMEEKIDRGFHTGEHIHMQSIVYNSSVNYDLSNMVRTMADYWGFVNLPIFSPLRWADPATTPIPQLLYQDDLQNQLPVLDEMNQPVVAPVAPNGLDAISVQSSNIFKDLPDLENITAFGELESIFGPAKGKPIVNAEGDSLQEKEKGPREVVGKGKQIVTKVEDSSESEN